MAESTIISGPFGSELVPVPGLDDPKQPATSALPEGEAVRVPLNDSTVAGDAGFREARQAREERLYRPEASILESVGAGVRTWTTTRLKDRLARPAFDEDSTNWNLFEALENVPLKLTPDEQEYVQEVARGPQSLSYAVEQVQALRVAAGAMQQHPVAALAASFVDPVWLGVPPALRVGKALGSGRAAAGAVRVVSGVGSAGIAGAITASGEGPVSDTEIALNMLMAGTIGTVAYKSGKLVPKTDYPAQELNRVVQEVADTVTPPSPDTQIPGGITAEVIESRLSYRTKDAPDSLPGNHKMNDYIAAIAAERSTDYKWSDVAQTLLATADPRVWDMPVRLSGNAREYVSHEGFAVLRKDSDQHTILHEAVHVATHRQIQTFLSSGPDALGAVTKAGVEKLDSLFKELKADWELENGRQVGKDPAGEPVEYGFKNLHEFAAQAISSPDFQQWLAKRPGKEVGKSAWQDFLKSVARLLGINATGTKLNEVLEALNQILTARDTKFIEPSGKESLYAPKQGGIDLPANTANLSHKEVVQAVDAALVKSSKERGLGERMMWNMHKTMSNFGEVGKRVANILYDNNSNLSITSVESHREAVLSSLRGLQYKYEDLLRKAAAEDGYGLLKMVNPFTSRDAHAAQRSIERELQAEMFAREQAHRAGFKHDKSKTSPRIAAMADALDALHASALNELKRAGVAGSEELLERPGWVHRKWSSAAMDQVMDRLVSKGMTRENARKALNELVGNSVLRATPMDPKIAKQVGTAIVDRAMRKGYFEDNVLTSPAGEGQLKEMRDILKGSGMSAQDIERVLDVMRISSDDAGKAGYLKHRMDLDYDTTIRVGNEVVRVTELIDSNISRIVDQYISQVATSAAFARKGLKTRTEIDNLRSELLESIRDEGDRAKAAELFDNTMNHYRGLPAGGKVNENFRLLQAYGRSIALSWSGLWQLTEFANILGTYGLRGTLKYSIKEFPGFKQLLNPNAEDAASLANILAEHSSQSLRLRPYISRYEDGFDMDTTSALQLSLQSIGHVVPFANGMRYVHHYQARIVGNLILDRLDKAARGNAKARSALAEFGLDQQVMDKLLSEVQKHGYKVDAWDDAVWEAVRPSFAKMMDATVLRGRLGDMPAFAAFDPIGKFLFTYRTFVLVAHNKILAGGLERNGAAAVGLIMMYQFPLAMLAVQAQSIASGKGTLSEEDMVKRALGQMGGLGLFSEPLKWATGESNSVGAPGLIPLDRGIKLGQSGVGAVLGDAGAGDVASNAISALPIAAAIPFTKALQTELKEED